MYRGSYAEMIVFLRLQCVVRMDVEPGVTLRENPKEVWDITRLRNVFGKGRAAAKGRRRASVEIAEFMCGQ